MKPIEIKHQEDQAMEEYFMKPLNEALLAIDPEELVRPIVEGYASPITGLEAIQHVIKKLEEAKKLIEDMAVDEAEKYNKYETIPTQLGYRITLKAGRPMFKYNDPLIKAMEQKLKYYRDCAKNGVAVEDTGEVLEAPEVTYTKDTLTFTKL